MLLKCIFVLIVLTRIYSINAQPNASNDLSKTQEEMLKVISEEQYLARIFLPETSPKEIIKNNIKKLLAVPMDSNFTELEHFVQDSIRYDEHGNKTFYQFADWKDFWYQRLVFNTYEKNETIYDESNRWVRSNHFNYNYDKKVFYPAGYSTRKFNENGYDIITINNGFEGAKVNRRKTEEILDNNGNCLTKLSSWYDDNKWNPSFMEVFVYDDSCRVTEKSSYSFPYGNKEICSKTTFEYDEKGNVINEYHTIYDDGRENAMRHKKFEFNELNQSTLYLEQTYEYSTKKWTFEKKKISDYDSRGNELREEETYQSGDIYLQTYEYNESGYITKYNYTYYDIDLRKWQQRKIYRYGYDSEDRKVAEQKWSYNIDTNTWESDSWKEYFYNEKGHLLVEYHFMANEFLIPVLSESLVYFMDENDQPRFKVTWESQPNNLNSLPSEILETLYHSNGKLLQKTYYEPDDKNTNIIPSSSCTYWDDANLGEDYEFQFYPDDTSGVMKPYSLTIFKFENYANQGQEIDFIIDDTAIRLQKTDKRLLKECSFWKWNNPLGKWGIYNKEVILRNDKNQLIETHLYQIKQNNK